MAEWIAAVFIFSGRPDPTWQVDEAAAQALLNIWDELEAWRGQLPSPPPLGYRGCALREGQTGEWTAFEHVVTLTEGDASTSRWDAEDRFEKRLFSSAPPDKLPTFLTEK